LRVPTCGTAPAERRFRMQAPRRVAVARNHEWRGCCTLRSSASPKRRCRLWFGITKLRWLAPLRGTALVARSRLAYAAPSGGRGWRSIAELGELMQTHCRLHELGVVSVVRSRSVPSNKELKLTKPSQNGALQLNSSVRRTVASATRAYGRIGRRHRVRLALGSPFRQTAFATC
jgi:hypothetical protein